MSSVGAIGGVGNAGGGSVGGVGSVGGPSGAGGAGGVESAGGQGEAGSINNDDTTAAEMGASDGGLSSKTENNYYNSFNSSMSTQDHLHLQNSAVGECSSAEGGDLDLKKLIEMMLAIKLLQEMNKMLEGDDGSEGGFSAIG